ncbi:exo-beta-N-acetylmuramidase NamZ domain-containing protein [Colwellia psychrerythraea]|uniref:Putative conserved protein UCP016719 n=1 Tax=Colwellia psychrerythraea TaxID=28229 RepID=A0A099KSN6_COLPS|nr:DUF1343 domain-containing protein [Colwellia psychrerythraea]KGJ92892.1 putative conserved protein UCP016719 [Colwellia psychrerythraea]
MIIKLTVFFKTITLLFSVYLSCFSLTANADEEQNIIVGAERLAQYLPKLTGKRVALVVNQTSTVFDKHLVDILLKENINIKMIFAPEHGFRGMRDAGEKFDSSIDTKTGIALVSLYGKNRKPSLSIMSELDVIIFDIQDVGVRFYTYISTMHYMMEAAADAGIEFIVLDRPNPNGAYIDGPVLEDEFRSFVGMHQIPLLHGLTVAELAQMIKGEHWLKSERNLALTVVKVKNYQRDLTYNLPIKPSPNLPNAHAVSLYPSLAFFEATPVSIGRGTQFPFEVIGHNEVNVGNFSFTPVSTPGAASKPKLMNKRLVGEDLRQVRSQGLDLSLLLRWQKAFAVKKITFFNSPTFMDKLAGTDKLRKAIISGQTAQQIKHSWQADLDIFKQKRRPYLLYPDIN